MAPPRSIRALRVHAFGEAPRLDVVPLPAAGRGEALVRLEATVIAHHDLGVAAGTLPARQPLPFVPGLEGAGRVEVVEDGAGLAPGTRVRVFGGGLGTVRAGTWAEAVVAPLAALTALPEAIEPTLAAAFGSVANTAWAALFDVGNLAAGQSVGVSGATGAVGSLVVQLAAEEPGRRVVAWARAPERVGGGAEALPYDEDPGEPVDLLVDTVGGPAVARRLRSVRPGGRAVLLGYTAGERLWLELPSLLIADVSLLPLNMRRRRVPADVVARLTSDLARGRLTVPIDVVGLDELETGIARLKAGTAKGRLVLAW